MIVTLLSAKGGVGKSTSAIHLAAYLQSIAPTLLVDGDGIRSATKWGHRGNGNGLPFKVVSYAELAREAPKFAHIVIDTEGNPSDDDFRDATKGSDLVIIPSRERRDRRPN
jgi:chromosome partitioning protein